MNTPAAATVLLVDDEANILSALRRLLRPAGYRILTAESGAEALELLETDPVDLVISDMRMPGMDGAAFLTRVRERWPQTLRILLTGYADMEATIAAINQGEIYRYVAKPWNDQDLKLLVSDALAMRRLEQENQRLVTLTAQQNEELKLLNADLERRVAERTQALTQALARADAAHKQLRETYLATVRVFTEVIESRSSVLAGHGRRVADVARGIGRLLRLDEAAMQELTLASLLHDLGKLSLPDSLLDKPFTQLNAQERTLVMRHPSLAENLLGGIAPLREVAKVIRHHHEHFDGTGYPDRLSGLNIPLAARILTVANDYDALQLGTLVGRVLSREDAMRFIVDNRSKRYDPSVVEAMVQVAARQPGEPQRPTLIVRTPQLRPGMRLARDLVHPDGYLLLARGIALDEAQIGQLKRIEQAEGKPLVCHIDEEGTELT
jgi:response regulator RpfG family c-di-GMP phosphodiesterase